MAGFIRGILWGGVVAVGGLLVVSQIAPPVRPPVPGMPPADVANAPLAPTPTPAPASEVMPDPTPKPEVAAATVDEPVGNLPAASGGLAGAEAPATPSAEASAPVPQAAVEAPEGSAETGPDAASGPEVESQAPAAQKPAEVEPPPQAPDAGPATLPVGSGVAGLTDPAAADGTVVPPPAPQQAPEPPPSDAPDSGLATAVLPEATMPSEAPGTVPGQIADAPIAVPPGAPTAPSGELAPGAAELPPPPLAVPPSDEALLEPAPEDVAPPVTRIVPGEPVPSLPAPRPGLSNTAEGVITGRLPRIGDPPGDKAGTDATGPGAQPMPEPALDPEDDATLPPLQRFARPFENPDRKPLFAVLLEDEGGEVDRAALAALALPLTIVIDPLSEGAADRAALWRAAGQEIVLSAASLPERATPGDLEQIFQALANRLPEAVAVIDPTGGEFQSDRSLAAQIVPILAEQGRGLVTFDQGLNAADQVAQREGLAATTVFRRFDLDNAGSPAVKRYLDRAVFRAAQEGQVAVIGALRPEIVAGLLEWTVEGRASTVALAPLSALLSR